MVESRPTEFKMRYVVLIALLINGGIILLFFFSEFYSELFKFPSFERPAAPVVFDQLPMPVSQPEPEQRQQEVAALKARASIFGATDDVQDEPEFSKGHTDSDSMYEDASGQDVNFGDNTALAQEVQKAVSTVKKDAEQHVEQQVESVLEAEEKVLKAHEQNVVMPSGGLVKAPPPALSAKSQKEAQPQAKPRQEIKQELYIPRASKQTATRNNTGKGTKNASPIKRELTFADLARGFLESHEHKGEDWFNRKGNENIRPDAKEMKYLSYLQRLYWHLQSIVKQNVCTMQPGWPHQMHTDLVLIINRQGIIEQVAMVNSSGCRGFDDYCLSLFLNNTTGCPPIPQHLPDEYIRVPFSILLAVEKQRIRFSYY